MQSVGLQEFMSTLKDIENNKNDYIVPTSKIKMHDDEKLDISGAGDFGLNSIAHGQLANKLQIPKKYYDKIGEYPGMRDYNVNRLLEKSNQNMMVRTVKDTSRAILSDKYFPVDNYLVLNEVMPALTAYPGTQITSTNISESRMYVQVVFPHTERAVAVGDMVQYGLTLSNSEVGHGAMRVDSTIWRLRCLNGMIGASVINKRHVGRRLEATDDMSLFRRETIQADLKAFTMKLTDVIQHSLEEAQLEALFAPIRQAAGMPIEKPEETVKNVTKRFDLNEWEGQHILRNMLQEDNWTKWGVINGITNAVHATENPDRQFELERIGNDVLTLPESEWTVLSA